MKFIWLLCATVNLAHLMILCYGFKKETGYLNYPGVAFLTLWSIVLAPCVTFCMMLYYGIEGYDYLKEREDVGTCCRRKAQ